MRSDGNLQSLVRQARQRTKDAVARHATLAKYLLIGGTAAVLDLSVFFLLFNFTAAGVVISQTVAMIVGLVFSFALNATKNFQTTDRILLRLLSFVCVCAIGFLLGLGIILAFAAAFPNPVIGGNIGKVVSLPFVFIVQYTINKKVTFRKSS